MCRRVKPQGGGGTAGFPLFLLFTSGYISQALDGKYLQLETLVLHNNVRVKRKVDEGLETWRGFYLI